MGVVDVVGVREGHVSAALAVDVAVIGVLLVRGSGHRFLRSRVPA
ncbi:hypothetical protein [Nocardia farcinica]|nr:hypothetical protein [Nocardia farcinica]